MRKILSTFVKYPFYGKVVIAILLLIGGYSLLTMKKSSFPITESHTITISVTYQGATPKEMEEGVTTLIENAIRGTVGIKEFTSISRENSAVVTITTLSEYDVDEVMTEVKNVVDGISNFPVNAERPVVSKRRTTTIAMFLGLSSESDDLIELKTEAQRIEDDFLASGIISQITIMGYPSKMEMAVEIDEAMLQRYGLSINDIQNAISANNNDVMGGTVKGSREEILIVSRQRSIDPDDIENIVVKATPDGANIRVKDVASVALQFEEVQRGNYINQDRNVVIMIDKLASEDLEAISDYIHEYMDEYNATHQSTEMYILHDFLSNLKGQLGILYSNGLLGMILVVVSLSLFLSFRLSLWVSWGIPASFLGMFMVANLMGITINIISVFGMILIIGILVDDGIVIGENIFSHFEKGKSPRRSAIDGTMEVLPAVFVSVATTIIAFMPLFFIEGNLEMMYEMGLVVVLCLLFSLLEGMFVLPGHLASPKVLRENKKNGLYARLRRALDKGIFYFRDRLYLPFLKWILHHRWISLGIVTASFILTIGLIGGGRIGFTFFPRTTMDNFVIDLVMKPGVKEEVVLEKLFDIEESILEVNEELMEAYNDSIPFINYTQAYTGSAFNGTENGTNAGGIRVFLRRMDRSPVDDQIIKRAIAEKVGTIPEAYKFTIGASDRFGAPVSFSMQSYDMEELEAAKTEFETELAKLSSLYNIMDNSQLGNQEIRITLKPKAYTLGLTQSSLMNQVRQAFYGGLSQRMQEGKDEIWVYVRYPLENRETIGQLDKMLIETPMGNYPLSEVADYTMERGLTAINRYNGQREIRVDAYMLDPNEPVPPILDEVEATIIPMIQEKYDNVKFVAQGQQKDTNEEMESIMKYYSIAFIIIVLIIMIYFRSAIQGLMIIFMIPLGLLGAVWGHGIEGATLSLMSIWGMVALSGTIINDAVVLLDKYNRDLKRGFKVNEAILNAAQKRFRPILLTTITTTVGLFPLIKEVSSDAQFIIPMAVALAYGILFGTFFILTVFPVLIQMANSLQVKWKKLIHGGDVTPEEVERAVKDQQVELALSQAMEEDFTYTANDIRNEKDDE